MVLSKLDVMLISRNIVERSLKREHEHTENVMKISQNLGEIKRKTDSFQLLSARTGKVKSTALTHW